MALLALRLNSSGSCRKSQLRNFVKIQRAIYRKTGAQVCGVEEAGWGEPGELGVRMEYSPVHPADIHQLEGRYDVYEDLPSHRFVDWNPIRGRPVIVRVRLRGGTHFVVSAAKLGLDYLIRDPGAGSAKGLCPLKDLARRVEALRFYERL